MIRRYWSAVMNKKICLFILLSILMPACVRKKAATHKKGPQKTQAYDENLPKTTYDEDVGAFVLEDDAGHDIFSEAQDSKTVAVAPEVPVGMETSDLDEALAWQELDEDQQLPVIQFDFDSALVRPDQESTLKYIAQQARTVAEDGATVIIEGHSCLIARSQIYNQALSQKRADVIMARLIALGVPAKSIKAVGRGTSCLITQVEGKEAQAPNRRAEVKFVYGRVESTVKRTHKATAKAKKAQKKKVKTSKAKIKKTKSVSKHSKKKIQAAAG